jgi:Flp pilus assembly protein TadG
MVGRERRRGTFGAGCRRRRDERGAALVETAILIPVVILVTFGLIEFSSAYQSDAVAAGSARSAARTASAEAKLPTYAEHAALAAATALKNVPADEPIEMWIYKANPQGYPGATGNTSFSSCATACVSYQWNPTTRSFDTASPGGGGWAYSSQQACNSTNWDSVGVWVKLRHKYITKLFGSTIDLTDHAVFRLEPAPTQLCTT